MRVEGGCLCVHGGSDFRAVHVKILGQHVGCLLLGDLTALVPVADLALDLAENIPFLVTMGGKFSHSLVNIAAIANRIKDCVISGIALTGFPTLDGPVCLVLGVHQALSPES